MNTLKFDYWIDYGDDEEDDEEESDEGSSNGEESYDEDEEDDEDNLNYNTGLTPQQEELLQIVTMKFVLLQVFLIELAINEACSHPPSSLIFQTFCNLYRGKRVLLTEISWLDDAHNCLQ